MFSKLWKPMAMLVAVVGSLAAAPQASADWNVRPSPALRQAGWVDIRFNTDALVRHHHSDYHVYYRTCAHDSWRCYGHYDCRESAHRVLHRLRASGYEVYIR